MSYFGLLNLSPSYLLLRGMMFQSSCNHIANAAQLKLTAGAKPGPRKLPLLASFPEVSARPSLGRTWVFSLLQKVRMCAKMELS